MSQKFFLLLRIKVNVVLAGLSQQLVCLNLSSTWTIPTKNSEALLNNNSLIVVVLWDSVVKVVEVLGLLMQLITSKHTVLFKKVNMLTLLKMVLANKHYKTLVSSLVNNSKSQLATIIYVKELLNNLFQFVLMLLNGTCILLVFSIAAHQIHMLLIMLFF